MRRRLTIAGWDFERNLLLGDPLGFTGVGEMETTDRGTLFFRGDFERRGTLFSYLGDFERRFFLGVLDLRLRSGDDVINSGSSTS